MSALRPVLKSGSVLNSIRRAYHGRGDFQPATLSDLPVPCGSWKQQYDAANSKYNIHLAAGIATAIVTIFVAKSSGLVYMNYSPPSKIC